MKRPKPWFIRMTTYEYLGTIVERCMDLADGPEYSYSVDTDDPFWDEEQVERMEKRIAELEAIIVEGQGVGALPFDGQESGVALLGKRIAVLEAELAQARETIERLQRQVPEPWHRPEEK